MTAKFVPTALALDPGVGPQLALAPNVFCGTTLRGGGMSDGPYAHWNLATHVGDRPAVVGHNRQRLHDQLAPLTPDLAFQWLDQVHGIAVVAATRTHCASVPSADAVWTAEPGLALAILTADCMPVVISDVQGSCVGVAHAGWRGLVQGVLQELVNAMPVPNHRLHAWIGPSIRQENFEVGPEVAEAVLSLRQGSLGGHSPAAMGLEPGRRDPAKWQLGMQPLAAVLLASVGVNRVQDSGICAFADPRCYSYRREAVTGRMATVVVAI